MKYLKIQNNGELDIRLILLMGGTTKTGDQSKIGQFGTGLKYAISYLIRNDINFYLFTGETEVEFTVKEESISGKDFKSIYCNGASMNITTHYGYQWKAWEALREIYCNAMDEGQVIKKSVNNDKPFVGELNKTTFYIEHKEPIKEVLKNWGNYFFKTTPLFENETVAIYPNPGENLKLYKNGVLIQDSPYYTSAFVYDLKEAPLNELRQYQGYLSSDIGNALLSSNKAVISMLLEAISDETKKDLYEVKLDWSYKTYNAEHVKNLFSGWLYLHPLSSKGSNKSIKVNETLFELLTKVGLPTEKITQTSGGWYGGSGLGHSKDGKVFFKEILNPELQKRIQHIATKYGSSMKYAIAVPKETEFDFVVNGDKVVFNAMLEMQNEEDLAATVLVAVMHMQESNMYKAFKRLIKFASSNRNFRKILFGRNILDKVKPVYQAPSIKTGSNIQPAYDELDELPF